MDEPGPSTITEIPLKAMFVPTRSKGEERRRKRKEKHALPVPYSPGEVLWHDVRDFLGHGYVDEMIARKKEEEWEAPAGLEKGTEVVVRAGDFTVSGWYHVRKVHRCWSWWVGSMLMTNRRITIIVSAT